MAILSDKYFKITGIENNLINNSSLVYCTVYATIFDREREKRITPLVVDFINNAEVHIMNLETSIKDSVNLSDLDNYDTFMDTLENNSEIKKLYENMIKISDEFMKLKPKLLFEKIDIDTLNYLKLWKELGFNIDMCTPINKYQITVGFPEITDTVDFSELYTKLKTRVLNSVDC